MILDRSRCLVCGLEWPFDPEEPASWRDEHTGAVSDLVASPVGLTLYLYPDGAVAGCCEPHGPDEARTAYVLAARTLTVVPAVSSPRIGARP